MGEKEILERCGSRFAYLFSNFKPEANWVYSWILYSFYLSDLVYSPSVRRMLGSLSFTGAYFQVMCRLHPERACIPFSFFFFPFSVLISHSVKRYGRDQIIAIFHAEGAANCIFWERWCSLYYSLWTISKNSELLILLMKNTAENWDWENHWCWNLGTIPV